MNSTFPRDGSIRLAHLSDEIEHHQLGPAFMEVLYCIVTGAETYESATAKEMWAVTLSTTPQRIQAAEQVLSQQGIPLP